MEIATISFFLFLVSYALLFIGVLFMATIEELSSKTAAILLIGAFPFSAPVSVLIGLLFKILLV